MKKTGKQFYRDFLKGLRAAAPNVEARKFNFSATLRQLRLAKEMTGAELCRRAGDLDPKTLTALEKGRIRNPSMVTLHSVARGLGMPVSDLFKQNELTLPRYYSVGTQKGAYSMDLMQWGIRVISFTPLIKEFFLGKLIFGGKRCLEAGALRHPYPIYLSVLVGRFEVMVEDRKCSLREGENLFFHGAFSHSITNCFQRESVLLLNTSPSFI